MSPLVVVGHFQHVCTHVRSARQRGSGTCAPAEVFTLVFKEASEACEFTLGGVGLSEPRLLVCSGVFVAASLWSMRAADTEALGFQVLR